MKKKEKETAIRRREFIKLGAGAAGAATLGTAIATLGRGVIICANGSVAGGVNGGIAGSSVVGGAAGEWKSGAAGGD